MQEISFILTVSNSNRVMGLDVGDAHIGIALSDPLNSFALPHSTLDRKRSKTIIQDILNIAVEQQIATIVVGLPYELDGTIGPQALKVKTFFASLAKAISKTTSLAHINALLFDERFTSTSADRVLIGSGLRDKERRKARDQIAAALIVEGYLESRPKSSI